MSDGRNRGTRCAALLAALALSCLAIAAQAPDIALVFVSPEDGGYVSGPTPIRLRVTPDGAAVGSVSVFADGRLVCTLEQPPFECPWDAGPNVAEHVLRAVAALADGRRVTRTIRTQGVAYTEKVDVDVVQVTATVTDEDGRFVRGLTRQDFRLYEDDMRAGPDDVLLRERAARDHRRRGCQRQHDGRDAEGEGVRSRGS